MSCPYCTSSDIQARTIIANDHAFAFLGNMPIVPGHTLIVPKRHVAKYEELSTEEMRAIEELRQKLMHALVETFGAQGFNFAWNDGAIAGQSVPHFHLHVVPRIEGDTGVHGFDPRAFLYRPGERKTASEDKLRAVSQRIARSIV
jgi:diadenosine tetraphosphate (Ap4A) HIT family hydrolase